MDTLPVAIGRCGCFGTEVELGQMWRLERRLVNVRDLTVDRAQEIDLKRINRLYSLLPAALLERDIICRLFPQLLEVDVHPGLLDEDIAH
jgi:hypothetical protein